MSFGLENLETYRSLFVPDIFNAIKEIIRSNDLHQNKIRLEVLLRTSFTRAVLVRDHLRTESFFEFISSLIEQHFLDESFMFILFEDAVELSADTSLPFLLSCIEDKVKKWTLQLSSTRGSGLSLLRSLNNLNRKVSKAKHSETCGRSLLLLSKLFPLAERSGLNLKGDYNSDNINLGIVETLDEKTSDGLHELLNFWSFHPYTYQPINQFDAQTWEKMQKSVSFCLDKLSQFKAEDLRDGENDSLTFFTAQHLVNSEIFTLELRDQSFRLAILAQVLIFLQSVNAWFPQDSSKSEKRLDSDKENWLINMIKVTYSLISQQKDGRHVFKLLRNILRLEKSWITWKNETCPSLDKAPRLIPAAEQGLSKENITFKRSFVGTKELSRLWSYNQASVKQRKLKSAASNFLEDVPHGEEAGNDPIIIWKRRRLDMRAHSNSPADKATSSK